MSQTITIPEACQCKEKRIGIAEGVAYYGCGSTLTVTKEGRAKVSISRECLRLREARKQIHEVRSA